jgi:Glycosyl transferase family 2
MKIQAVSASLPLLDWRILGGARPRIRHIDPQTLGCRPFLKGFGRCGLRSTVSIPWRPQETVFFEGNCGIRLPRHLPGGNGARRALRRVYIAGPQVRFELALFASMRPEHLRSCRYREAARSWWSAVVKIRDRSTWDDLPLREAHPKLRTRFREETSPRFAPKGEDSDISILPQQLLLTCLVPRADVPRRATLVVEDPPVWLLFASDTIRQEPRPDVGFILIEQAAAHQMGVERFSIIRRIRRELIWLHADLQFLLEIGRVLARDDRSPYATLVSAARKVAESLSRLDGNEAWGLDPLLFAAWAKARANQLALWRNQIGTGISPRTPLPDWFLREPQHGIPERRRVYMQTLGDRLESTATDNHYPADDALQLGSLALVEKPLLGEGAVPEYYMRERQSVFDTYFALPKHERKSISIVIPVRGGAFPLVACLESIAGQSLFKACPGDLQVLIIEDGPLNPQEPILLTSEILSVLKNSRLEQAARRFVLRSNQGRAVARNVGIFKASGDVIMFLDASMVLEENHLAEHAVRHHRIPNRLALLGFKENLTLPTYSLECFRSVVASIARPPDPGGDWKWKHTIADDEVGQDGLFRFRSYEFRPGETVNYMQLTNYLRDLSPCEPIGARFLPTFFSTNIATMPAGPLLQVGGFHSRPFSDKLWGLEDSHLGALLLAAGLYLVPCPSATAFKIEHPEGPERGEFDLPRHRRLYQELLHERMGQRAKEAEEEIQRLEESRVLEEIGDKANGGS